MSFCMNHFHSLERMCSPVCFEGRLEWDVVKRPGWDRLHPTSHFHVDVELSCCCLLWLAPNWDVTDNCQIELSHWSGDQQDRLYQPMRRQLAGMTIYGYARGLWGGGWLTQTEILAVTGCSETVKCLGRSRAMSVTIWFKQTAGY